MSREQLYELAWTEPLSKLAPQLGLSDVGLAKILDRLKVPRPGAGHWTRVSLGKTIARPKLPDVIEGDENSVTIKPRGRRSCDPAIDIEPAPIVRVSRRLSNPHKLVQRAREVLPKWRADRYGRLAARGVLAIKVSNDALPRALRAMDAAIKALEARGHAVVIRDGQRESGTCAVIEGQAISFNLREDVEQKPHEMTVKEQAEEMAGGRHWGPTFDYFPTGRLHLEIDHWSKVRGAKGKWRDSVRRSLEEQLGEFVVGIEAIGRQQRKRADEREAEERRAEVERAHAEAEEDRKRREAQRRARLVETAEKWRTAANVREFLLALEQRGRAVDGISTLIEWGRSVADELDPLTKPEDLESRLAADSGRDEVNRATRSWARRHDGAPGLGRFW